MRTYKFDQDWKKLLELFQVFRKLFKTDLIKSKMIGLKIATLLIIHFVYLMIFELLKYYYDFHKDIEYIFILHNNLFANFIPLIFLIIFHGGFKEINQYWLNIVKWHKISLKIKTGKDTVFCKNLYSIVYKMCKHTSNKIASTWITTFFLLENVISSILFASYVFGVGLVKEITLWSSLL